MTLHEAMVQVLRRRRGGWVSRDELARLIAADKLYTRRDGRPAPSDQLRLRARKCQHLFECSDTACTRIRLRADAVAPETTPRRRTPSRPTRERRRTDADRARDRRSRAARKYRPKRVRLLLVAEAPPSALDRYFYFEDVREQDSLFRYVARGILGVEPTRTNKSALLTELRDHGVFLVDLKLDPTDATALADQVSGLLQRVRRLAPEKIILIKAGVYDAAFHALVDAGLPVVDERVPFPGSGQQPKFEAAFARALTKRPKRA